MIIFINCYQFWSDPFTSCKPSPHYAKKFSRRNQFWTTCQTKQDLGKRPKPNPVSVVERWVELEPINLSWPAHSLLSFDDDKIFKNTTLMKFAWLVVTSQTQFNTLSKDAETNIEGKHFEIGRSRSTPVQSASKGKPI